MTVGGQARAAAGGTPMPPGPPQTAGVGGVMAPSPAGGLPPTPPRKPFNIPITGNKAADILGRGLGGSRLKVTSPTDPSKAHFYESRATGAAVGALSLIDKNIDPSVAPRTTLVG